MVGAFLAAHAHVVSASSAVLRRAPRHAAGRRLDLDRRAADRRAARRHHRARGHQLLGPEL